MRNVMFLTFLLFLTPMRVAIANTEYLRDRENLVAPTECTNVPKLDQNMGPPRSQTNSQWCYAFQTADLLAFEIGRPVSAADVALIYNDNEDERLHSKKEKMLHTQMQNGGEPRRALGWMIKKGICLEQDFPSEGYLVRRSANSGEELRLISILAEIEDYQRKIQADRSKDCEVCANYIVRQRDIYNAVFPHLSDIDLMMILKRADEYSVLSELQEKNCQGRRLSLPTNMYVQSIRGYPGEKFSSIAQENVVRRMDERLSKGKPVGITVTADFLGLDRKLGMHAVSVISRRFNSAKNRCEYLIRDSDPDNCSRAVSRNGEGACDGKGNWWASREEFIGKLDEVTFLREGLAPIPDANRGYKSDQPVKKRK